MLHLQAPPLLHLTLSTTLDSLPRVAEPAQQLLTRARRLLSQKKYDQARAFYLAAGKVGRDQAGVLNSVAWELLTRLRRSEGDDVAALEFATRAVELTHGVEHHILDTLALACFRRDRPAEAVRWQVRALTLSPANREYRNRLERFRRGLAASSARSPVKPGR